jgi:hypothetical protein
MSEEYEHSKGGEQRYEGDGPNVRYDDFVGRIVQDPNEPPNVTLLSGYLGSSSEEGHVRLYLDEELSRYVEIPEKAIRHTQELPPEQSPLGGSLVWIDRDAEVVHGAAGAERRKATFLEGQIAQDYIGGAGGTGPVEGGAEAAGGFSPMPTILAAACGRSQFGPCIPRTELLSCRTLTGIFCTRFGPGCRRTVFEPVCTHFGPNCQSIYVNQCMSVLYPCVTQNQNICQVSGGAPCYPPTDVTIWQEQYGQQAGFAAARRGPLGGFDDPTFTVFQTGSNCPSVFDNCATQESFCPSQSLLCSSQLGVCDTQLRLCVTRSGICDFETRSIQNCIFSVNVRCPPTEVNCPTRFEPRCFASRVAICVDTRAGCQVASVACGFDPAGGGVVQRQADIAAGPGAVAVQPTRFCPSRLTICPSQLIRCRTRNPFECFPTWILICNPTRYNCPTLPNGCPEPTVFGQCETFGACPSAVDACPSRFGCESQAGCFESQVCGVSQGCFPGGGGVDPAGGGGGGIAGGAGGAGAQGFRAAGFAPQPQPETVNFCAAGAGGGAGAAAAIPQTRLCPSQYTRCPSVLVRCPSQVTPCQSQLIRCPSALDACPTRVNCPSLPNGCPGYTQYGSCETFGACPSAVDACPSRFGCYETQVCGESRACNPGGGFDPGGFGGGGFGGGF